MGCARSLAVFLSWGISYTTGRDWEEPQKPDTFHFQKTIGTERLEEGCQHVFAFFGVIIQYKDQ